MLGGMVLGVTAIHTLHAQAKKIPAYTIAEITIKDQERYDKEFLPAIVNTVRVKGGKFIIRDGKTETLSGSPPASRVTVTQFENFDKAREWWNSKATKDAFKICEKCADIREFIVEGAFWDSP
jgi:uncharacterized protein (DUF1330 family)